MPSTIRTNDPRELLALIPYQLGFQPQESAVLVGIGPGSRVGLVARADLADLAEVGGVKLATRLASSLHEDGARTAVVVLYTALDLDAAGPTAQPRRAAANLAAAGTPLSGAPVWVVGPRGYFGLDCTDPTCCPPAGRPLTDLECTRVSAQMVLEGVQVARSRAELVRIASAGEGPRRSARRARRRWDARGRAAASGGEVDRWRAVGLRCWRAAFAADPAPAALGRVQAALDDVLVRDAVLVDVLGCPELAERVTQRHGGADVTAALGNVVGRGRTRPAPARVRRATALLEQVLAHAPRGGHAPAWTLLAVLAWWQGDGARANICVERALRLDPGYRLAVLVDQALALGIPPDWVRPPGRERAGSPDRPPTPASGTVN